MVLFSRGGDHNPWIQQPLLAVFLYLLDLRLRRRDLLRLALLPFHPQLRRPVIIPPQLRQFLADLLQPLPTFRLRDPASHPPEATLAISRPSSAATMHRQSVTQTGHLPCPLSSVSADPPSTARASCRVSCNRNHAWCPCCFHSDRFCSVIARPSNQNFNLSCTSGRLFSQATSDLWGSHSPAVSPVHAACCCQSGDSALRGQSRAAWFARCRVPLAAAVQMALPSA